VHLDAEPDQLRGDIRLQIGKSQHQVGLQLRDLVDLRARECRHARLLPPGARRTNREAGDADDARFLA
jgi:hypothetical protein